MAREIDEDGAIPMPPPPGPFVDAHRFEGRRGRERSPPDQAEQGGRTNREPQAGGEPGPGVPAEREADRAQSGDESVGFAGVRGDEVRQALGEDAARAGQLAAYELPYGQLKMDSK